MLLARIKQTKIMRFVICTLRIPFYYIGLRGHVSKRNGLATDKGGSYIPWITYPAIDFLDNIDFSDCNVFEFGSGSSTFWWQRKAKKVTSVEMDRGWYEKLKKLIPKNVNLLHVENGAWYPGSINSCIESFDVIIVDGAERYRCVVSALNKISDRGIIVLDNTEWYPNTAKKLRDNGYTQIDFYGLSPSNSFTSITSVFFRSSDILGNRFEVTKNVIGGNELHGGALDDH